MLWLNIKNYEGKYQLSDKGDLRKMTPKGFQAVKACKASNGKLYITLWKDGKRKTLMLHNVYADTFKVSGSDAHKIIYENCKELAKAKDNLREWLLLKIVDCEQREQYGEDMHAEIMYLKTFLSQIND